MVKKALPKKVQNYRGDVTELSKEEYEALSKNASKVEQVYDSGRGHAVRPADLFWGGTTVPLTERPGDVDVSDIEE